MSDLLFTLLRHGQTLANEQHIYCGGTDLPLSQNGKKELLHLKEGGLYNVLPGHSLWVCSPMLRTQQTVEQIFPEQLGKILVWPGLEEYRFGDFEMHSYQQLKEDPAYLSWILDETGQVSCPNGESRQGNKQRTLSAFVSLCDFLHQRNLPGAGIACHGGTIALILDFLCPGEKNFYQWQPKPGHGYVLLVHHQKAEKQTVLSLQSF